MRSLPSKHKEVGSLILLATDCQNLRWKKHPTLPLHHLSCFSKYLPPTIIREMVSPRKIWQILFCGHWGLKIWKHKHIFASYSLQDYLMENNLLPVCLSSWEKSNDIKNISEYNKSVRMYNIGEYAIAISSFEDWGKRFSPLSFKWQKHFRIILHFARLVWKCWGMSL